MMRMRKFVLAVLVVVFSGWSSGASATALVVKNIATGYDDVSGQKLAYGTPDSDYVIGVSSPEGVGLTPHSSAFYNFKDHVSSNSRFIAIDIDHPESAHTNGGAMAAVGTYSFTIAFDLTGFAASSAQIEDVKYQADNLLSAVLLNGIPVFSRNIGEPEAQSYNEIDVLYSVGNVGIGLMQPGINTLEFQVYNALWYFSGDDGNNANPMGFRAEGLVTAELVPEPSTALLLGIGLASLAVRREKHG